MKRHYERWRGERERERKWIDNKIGKNGAKSISESLKINTSLTALDLGGYEKILCDEKEMKWKNEEKKTKKMSR